MNSTAEVDGGLPVKNNHPQPCLLAEASHDYRQPVQALTMLVELLDAQDQQSRRQHLTSARACAKTLSDMLLQVLDAGRLEPESPLLVSAGRGLLPPVQAIGMLLEIMDPDDTPSWHRRVALLRSYVEALSDMLMQVLDFNQLELGLYVPRLQPVVLDRLLEDVRQSFSTLARQKGLVLELELAVRPLQVCSDAHLLRRMLFNLVANAAKLTQTHCVRVECRELGGMVVVTVADIGIDVNVGMAEQQHEPVDVDRVCLPGERSVWEESLNFGLAIVRRGGALLGHGLQVMSVAGAGTRFTLNLGRQVPAERAAPGVAGMQAASLASLTVAVLEDDPHVLAGLLDTFRIWGCTAIGGGSLNQLESELVRTGTVPELLVSDLHISDTGNGLEAIQYLRSNLGKPKLPAILLTGDLDPQLKERACHQNVLLAHKPLRPTRLRGVVTQALHGPVTAANLNG